MTFNSYADDDETEEFDLRPPCPELFDGPLPNFDILGVLGSGGMGKVYKARQPNLDRVVALKILSGSAVDDELLRFSERFQREATAMARLRHPNIVSLYHYGETEEGQVYFVMEYIEGAELTDYIRSADAEPRHVLYWAIQICNAIQFAHENGIIHRDIKPSNLLIDGKGDVKIADFGLAKFSRREGVEADTQLTRTDVVVGTPHYIAPELLEEPSAVTPASDLYSVGVTLYQALTGILPRGVPSPPSQLVPELDPRWNEILFRCLSGAPGDRFSSAAELQDSLEQLLDSSDLIPTASLRATVPRSTAASRSPGSPRRGVLFAWAAAAAILSTAAYFAYRGWQHPPAVTEATSPMTDGGTRLPPSRPLQLSTPQLPVDERTLAVLELGESREGATSVQVLATPDDLVRIWEQPGSAGVAGLRSNGTAWSFPGESATEVSELTNLVWLAPAGNSTGAVRADGRCFLWKREGSLYPIGGPESFVMIVTNPDGDAILLGRDGKVRVANPGETDATTEISSIEEECLAIGGCGDLVAAMSRSGFLRVWRYRSGLRSPHELLFERKMEVRIQKEDEDPSPYPDRWIPVLPWAVVSPQGEIIPFIEEDQTTTPLPSLDTIRPGTFRFGNSVEAAQVRQRGAAWEFSGPWGRDRIEALENFTAGAVQIALSKDSAFALFPPTLDIAARFEAENPEPEPTTPEPDEKAFDRTWTSDRVEIQTRGKAWNEESAQVFLQSIETDLALFEPILARWGAIETPPKLHIKEGSSEVPSNWKSGEIHLVEGRLEELRVTLENRTLTPTEIDFLPPGEAFHPVARKLNPPGPSRGYFGETESHLAHFCRLFIMTKSGIPTAEGNPWEEGRTFLATQITSEDYRPESAMTAPETGERFFSGLLARLHDDYGGEPFLDRLLGRELHSLPDPSEPQQGFDHFAIAASFAAETNLVEFFEDELQWTISPETIDTIGRRFPGTGAAEMETDEFRPPPNDLLAAWAKAYEGDILPLTITHRKQLEELRARYRDAIERQILQYEEAGRTGAAAIFREEQDRVGPGYGGPTAFHPVLHRGLDPEAQQAVRELDRTLGRTYRERLRAIAIEASSGAGGKVTRALDELFRLQHLFTLEGKDTPAQWAFDRRYREVKTHSLESVYTPRVPLDFTLRYEELIRWAVDEGAAVALVQPITPSRVQRYTVRSIADVQAGRFIWQRLKILGIQRGAQAKPWTDIHLELVSRLEDLEALECGCGELRASTLESLSSLAELKTLSLSGAKIEGSETAGLASLGKMELEKLSLVGAEFPPETLAILATGPIARTLEELGLSNTETFDILPLSDFRKLKRLDITGCPVPQQNIEQFNRAMPDCLVVK